MEILALTVIFVVCVFAPLFARILHAKIEAGKEEIEAWFWLAQAENHISKAHGTDPACAMQKCFYFRTAEKCLAEAKMHIDAQEKWERIARLEDLRDLARITRNRAGSRIATLLDLKF